MFVRKSKHEAEIAARDQKIACCEASIGKHIEYSARILGDNDAYRAAFPADVRAVMNVMRDDWAFPFATMASDASEESGLSITPARAREIARALKAVGLASFGRTFSEDTTNVTGSGYFLTRQGWDVRKCFAARNRGEG